MDIKYHKLSFENLVFILEHIYVQVDTKQKNSKEVDVKKYILCEKFKNVKKSIFFCHYKEVK